MRNLKEFDYFNAWLLFFMIVTVGGGILGLVLGSLVAAFLGAGGMPLAQMTRILQVLGLPSASLFHTSHFARLLGSIFSLKSKMMILFRRENKSKDRHPGRRHDYFL